MSDLEFFKKMMKDKQVETSNELNAVTYTRISSKDQSIFSLDTQTALVEKHCEINGYNIVETFGKTHESAKNEDRIEFKKMIAFIKKRKKSANPIRVLVVAYTDRLSRSNDNIELYDKLKSMGLKIESATDGTLPEGYNGDFITKMKLLYSNYENNLRKEKCVNGIKAKIIGGGVLGNVPMGYDLYGPRVKANDRKQNEQEVKINAEGRLLKKAWRWKVQGYSDAIILERLEKLGLKMYKQKLSAMWRKPFYAGVIVNGHIDKPVKGHWTPLVSEKDFAKINGLFRKDEKEYESAINPARPLQGFINCPKCGKKFTGYEVKRTKTHYYKCNTKGCSGGNVNAETTARSSKDGAHDVFKSLLEDYSLKPELKPVFKELLANLFKELNKESAEEVKLLKTQRTKLESTLEKAEDLLFEGEINSELFKRKTAKVSSELEKINERLEIVELDLSNLISKIGKCIDITSNLHEMWSLANVADKQIIQKTAFPNKVEYIKANNSYRTSKVNSILLQIQALKGIGEGLKQKDSPELTEKSCLVAGTGLEPMTFGL